MTATINIEDLGEAKKDLDELAREMPNVAVRAINTAMTGVKTDMKALIRADYNIKAKKIQDELKVVKATKAYMRGSVTSKGPPIHLTDVTGTNQLNRGVKVNLKKSTGPRVIPRAFINRVSSGKEIVLRRPGRDQYAAITNLYGRYGPPGSGGTITKRGRTARLISFPGPHLATLYNTPENWAKLTEKAKERLDKAIDRETQSEFRRLQGKWGN